VAKANDRKVLIKPMPAKKVAKAAVKPAQKQAAAAAPQARTAVVTNAPAAINVAKKPAPTAAAAPVAQQAAQNTAPVPAQKFSLKKFFTTPAANSDSRETTMSFHNLLGTNPLPSASDQGAEPMSAVIYFANGSAQISAKGRAIVAKLVAMAGDENTIIRVVGHASRRTRDMDPVKHKLVNLNVSVQRANAVVAEILRRGVPRSKIEAVARGASMPMYLEIMPAGEAGNRRVEIFVERLS
jgi:outer membrane protein OmpA-like peptidoglycan-associated protein